MKAFSLFNCLFWLSFSLFSQDLNKAKLDSLFSIVEENDKMMGSLSIFRGGEEIYSKSIGYADVEQQLNSDEKTRYRVGSISKTFTSALIMQLVEVNMLTLETKLEKFYPDIPNASKIAIEDLLSHQSGLFNFTNDSLYLDYLEDARTKEELLSTFMEKGTVFEPKEKTQYSNTNYVLLTFIAEDVSGKNFPLLLKEKIVEPLGLKNTYYGENIGNADNEAKSYKKVGGWIPNTETNMSIPQGAGAIVSNPYDLNTFFTALFAGEIVKEESLEKMKGEENGKGLGIFPFPFNDEKLFGHTGGIDGFSSMVAYHPQEDLSFAFTSNGTDMGVNELMVGVLSIVFEKDYDLPSFSPVMQLSAGEIEPFAGLYSSPEIPLKIKIFVENDVLMGQGTGQPSFPLEATGNNTFKFDPAKLTMEFLPEEDKMILVQGGATYELTRE